MNGTEYQTLAGRTINKNLTNDELRQHALHGMASEVGEIHSIFQKSFQGHTILNTKVIDEVGDLLWFIAEFCTSYGWTLETVMALNIEKLKRRYPGGFDPERSIHRDEDDK